MGKVYNTPDEIKVPEFDFKKPYSEYKKKEDKFLKELKAFLVERNPDDKFVGEEINFPAADGYARYMVASLKPVELVHLPLGDAWSFQYADRLTKKDIEEKINAAKRIANLVPKRF